MHTEQVSVRDNTGIKSKAEIVTCSSASVSDSLAEIRIQKAANSMIISLAYVEKGNEEGKSPGQKEALSIRL